MPSLLLLPMVSSLLGAAASLVLLPLQGEVGPALSLVVLVAASSLLG
uniref:Uncharacterized protein n=1 Tax=Arundo donax TaxID=35708 RepID=A0A0A8ZNU6_ARUDO